MECKLKAKSLGFGTVEYLVGIIFLALLLFTPYNVAPINGLSVSQYLINMVRVEHDNYIYASSMPFAPDLNRNKQKNKKENNQ